MTSPRVPPLGLVEHPPRTVFLLETHFPDHPPALRGYAVRAVDRWADLRERVALAPPSSVALVRVEHEDGIAELEVLVRGTPSVPVVAALSFGAVDAGRVRAAIVAGAAEVANLDGLSTVAGLVSTLRRAHAQPLKRRMEERLPVWMGEDARTLVRAAAETAVDLGGREMLAGIFGVYVRTLSTRCADLRLPAPRHLLGWIRVLLALTLLEEKSRTVMNAARACGYNDNSSLRRAIENFTGEASAGPVRERGFAGAFDTFATELLELRHDIPRHTPARRV